LGAFSKSVSYKLDHKNPLKNIPMVIGIKEARFSFNLLATNIEQINSIEGIINDFNPK
jgi:hypothetical protein